jgi:hypothetical protein
MTKEMVGAERIIGIIGHEAASTLLVRASPVTCGDWCTGLSQGRPSRMNTPSQCAWCWSSTSEVSGRGWLVGVDGARVLMMLGRMVFGWIVAKVLSTWVPRDINILVADLVDDPKVAYFHGLGPLAFYGVIGNADGALLSQWMGVGGWECPISSRMSRKILTSCAVRKRAPSSASAADAATSLSTVHSVCTGSLSQIDWLFLIGFPRK